jgi:raffinose/stachyose/melibiose transport system substrate-binding protein
VFPIPAGEDETDAITAVTTGFQVNKVTRDPRSAVAFLELLLSRKYQTRFAELGNLSARRDGAEFTQESSAKRLLAILAKTDVIVPPPDTGYRPEQAAVFYEMCAKMLMGKLSLEQMPAYWAREKQSLAMKGL